MYTVYIFLYCRGRGGGSMLMWFDFWQNQMEYKEIKKRMEQKLSEKHNNIRRQKYDLGYTRKQKKQLYDLVSKK